MKTEEKKQGCYYFERTPSGDLRSVDLAEAFFEKLKKDPRYIKDRLAFIVNLCNEAEKQDVQFMLYALVEIRDNAELLIEIYKHLHNEN